MILNLVAIEDVGHSRSRRVFVSVCTRALHHHVVNVEANVERKYCFAKGSYLLNSNELHAYADSRCSMTAAVCIFAVILFRVNLMSRVLICSGGSACQNVRAEARSIALITY